MPVYLYHCTRCGEDLEATQKMWDTPMVICPLCQGRLRRKFGPIAVLFKGEGFYYNDSRKT